MAAPRGIEPRFTDSKSAVLPLDEGAAVGVREGRPARRGQENGAEDGTRTRDPHLGKVMLYQLSHFRSMTRPPPKRWCREPDSNWRHRDFQSRALPTELSRPDGQPGSVARQREADPSGCRPGGVSAFGIRPAADSSTRLTNRRSRVSGRLALAIHHTAPVRYEAGRPENHSHAASFARKARCSSSVSVA